MNSLEPFNNKINPFHVGLIYLLEKNLLKEIEQNMSNLLFCQFVFDVVIFLEEAIIFRF